MVTPADLRRADGFTLVELLVSLGVMVAVVGTAVAISSEIQTSYHVQMEAASAQEEGRNALDWITRYLRSAGSNPYNVTTTACPASGTTVLAVRMDPNGNGQNDDIRLQADINPPDSRVGGTAGACTETNEDVTIAFDSANRTITLRDNNVGGAATARTDGVINSLQFVYRNSSHNVTTSQNAVAYVEAVVTVRSRVNDPTTNAPRLYTLRSEVRVRTR
jgi:Tfp pilus assembly protein PilW